ncbi:hypothetical protein DYB37_001339 [Aphanomyces astaci]|uniref:Nucleotide-diphospho-sugar transferase domain-containing protein n=2 Tax=Aphanomyces astaci TaxID=112090 RepID=A0A418EUU3_APHAT|nr:hypothetical protein DYB37_001339 [Aphanomyces astaci]
MAMWAANSHGGGSTSSLGRLTLVVVLACFVAFQCIYFNSFLAVLSTHRMTQAHAYLRNQTSNASSTTIDHPHDLYNISSATESTPGSQELLGQRQQLLEHNNTILLIEPRDDGDDIGEPYVPPSSPAFADSPTSISSPPTPTTPIPPNPPNPTTTYTATNPPTPTTAPPKPPEPTTYTTPNATTTIAPPKPPLPALSLADAVLATSFHALFDRPDHAAISTTFPQATRGIVLSLHHAMVPIGASLVRELRALGNKDPIQVMHCFEAELPEADQALLLDIEDANVEIIDVCSLLVAADLLTAEAATDFQNYWLKPLAVLVTSFDEVMLLDVDNLFVRDPAELWTTPLYLDTGTLFFYDRVLNFNFWLNEAQADGRAYLRIFLETFPYTSFGLHPPTNPSQRLQDSMIYARHTAHEQDSSVVLLQKSRAGVPVLKILWHLATYQRHHGHPFSWYIRTRTSLSHYLTLRQTRGDKESFWLSFELGQVPYAFSPWAASVVAKPGDVPAHPDTLCGSLAQFVPTTNANDPAVLLFVNGGDVIDIVDTGTGASGGHDWDGRGAQLLADIPHHVTPRHKRHPTPAFGFRGTYDQTCLIGDGATALDESFHELASRRIRWAVDVAKRMEWQATIVHT